MKRLLNHALCVVVLTLSQLAQAAPVQLADLMVLLAQVKTTRATFVEQKFVAVLNAPVESSGELLYVAPARLEKRTLKPKVEALVLDGSELTVERGRRIYRIQLSDYPEVSAFVESMRSTLAGDKETLQRLYDISLEGSVDKWLLVLKPRERSMADVISRIRMTGSQAQIRTIEFEQKDGDRSVMTVTPAAGA